MGLAIVIIREARLNPLTTL